MIEKIKPSRPTTSWSTRGTISMLVNVKGDMPALHRSPPDLAASGLRRS
ncbi:Uncharacterised protein [Amycolatopsis camponoti]|uniref:Uncharacterized protein n=1 Tax=Amycolatopsis camponoti TaxID=2606593 RepID=A0A6I8LRC9_9PSEU|nr:Uncharacterised protein [Amycolatopsis camponoti]